MGRQRNAAIAVGSLATTPYVTAQIKLRMDHDLSSPGGSAGRPSRTQVRLEVLRSSQHHLRGFPFLGGILFRVPCNFCQRATIDFTPMCVFHKWGPQQIGHLGQTSSFMHRSCTPPPCVVLQLLWCFSGFVDCWPWEFGKAKDSCDTSQGRSNRLLRVFSSG